MVVSVIRFFDISSSPHPRVPQDFLQHLRPDFSEPVY
jgi:hypothetical protein